MKAQKAITPIKSKLLLLDLFPNAQLAFSVRKLNSAYTGSAIRVRRSSDNTEQDIGFAGSTLDETALINFVGSNNGFVTTWYDQSGNGNHAVQTTAAAQPKIVSSGVVEKVNNKPALYFDGTNDLFSLTTGISTITLIHSHFTVYKLDNVTNSLVVSLGETTGNGYNIPAYDGNIYQIIGPAVSTTWTANASQNLLSTILTGNTISDLDSWQNGSALANYTGSNPTIVSVNQIGSTQPIFLNYSYGYHQEIVLYFIDQTADRTKIETNINSYYAIY